ncbi:MAG TPA: RpiB/LacA/LacB family sugar-phosphate isomerase [Vicinamibacterales bacterium]|nr:RpiB/LacA/LacB family sugar-phosphate isomerase [Vicinamibacterales bacterium]
MATLRFRLIAEAEARQIEPGSVVELEAGGHVTPLAWDTLRSRRITVVPAGGVDASIPADLAPVSPAARVAVGADHTGLSLRKVLVGHLRQRGLAVVEHGPTDDRPADYPDVAAAVALAVVRRECDAGIAIDGAGLGSAMAANKVRGARAAMCTSVTLARYAREHNGANVLALGATLLSERDAVEIADTFLTTPTTEPRYLRRLLKVRRLEDRF